MSEGQYINYEPLSSAEKHFRTLTLCAGKVNDPIRCVLQVVALDESPAYEALSYTWGDMGVTRPIEVDGVQFHATVNLERALRHLREASHDLTLWVDAVCINQNDMDEKSQQVALMGYIYQSCYQVRIWLGCDAADCSLEPPLRRIDSALDQSPAQQDPFHLMRSMAEDRHIGDWPCFRHNVVGEEMEFEGKTAFDSYWAGFIKVAQSTWWTRMWTVQEVILPKQGILVYDTWSISLDAIAICGSNYYKHIWDCCQGTIAKLPSIIGNALDEFCAISLTLNGDRNSLADDEYFDIQEQHLSYGFRQCQNPRDKVYGLLALIGDVSDLDIWLTPNYSNSVGEVFHDATVAMLYRDMGSLKCLVGEQYGTRPGKWASWVRDFGAPMTQLAADIGSNRLMIYELFNASSGRRWKIERYMTWPPLADAKPYQVGLGAIGYCVGVVASVFSVAQSDNSSNTAHQQRRAYKEWLDVSKVGDNRYDDDNKYSDRDVKFWKTMLGGVMSAGSESTEYSDWRKFDIRAMAWMDAFLTWVHDGGPDLQLAPDRSLAIATDGRCYFQTDGGDQGLCYPATQTGDEIWIIDGSKVPLTLRHVHLSENESSELRPMEAYGLGNDGVYGLKENYERAETSQEYHSLVGDCDLDGYMDGGTAVDATRAVVLV